MVEGYTDVIAMHLRAGECGGQLGYSIERTTNPVATPLHLQYHLII